MRRQQYEPRQSRRDDGNPLQDIMQLMALSKMFGPEADQEQEMKRLQLEAAQQQMLMQQAQMEQAQALNPLQLKHLQAQMEQAQAQMEQAQALNPLQLKHLQAQIAREQAQALQDGPNAQVDRDLRSAQTKNLLAEIAQREELTAAEAYRMKLPQLGSVEGLLNGAVVKDFPYNIRPPMSFVPDDQQAAIRSQIEPLLQGFEPGSPQMGVQLRGAENAYPGMFEDMIKISPEKAAILDQWRAAAAPYEAEYAKLPDDVKRSTNPEVQKILQNPSDLGSYQEAMRLYYAKLGTPVPVAPEAYTPKFTPNFAPLFRPLIPNMYLPN